MTDPLDDCGITGCVLAPGHAGEHRDPGELALPQPRRRRTTAAEREQHERNVAYTIGYEEGLRAAGVTVGDAALVALRREPPDVDEAIHVLSHAVGIARLAAPPPPRIDLAADEGSATAEGINDYLDRVDHGEFAGADEGSAT